VCAATHHQACGCRQPRFAATGQGTGENEEHVHARHNDDAQEQDEEEPEILGIGHVSFLLASMRLR